MTHTRMCQEYPVSLEKLSFFFIQVKIIQVLVFDNWHPLKYPLTYGFRMATYISNAPVIFLSRSNAGQMMGF